MIKFGTKFINKRKIRYLELERLIVKGAEFFTFIIIMK